MPKKLKLVLAALTFALAGCTTLAPAPAIDSAPVTGRNWNCPACYK